MKMYFTVDTTMSGYPARYLDAQGKERVDERKSADPGEAIREFEIAHKNAAYLNQRDFARRVLQAAQDRAKLLAWKEWAV